MKISDNGIQFIKDCEGEKLTAYRDSVGVWTIGVGHTKNVGPGMRISAEQSLAFLRDDLAETEAAVNKLVKVALTQNQFDALVSLTFNIGSGNFASSRLLKYVNVKNFRAASEAFLSWNKGRVNGKLIPINGLTIRRGRERALFLA